MTDLVILFYIFMTELEGVLKPAKFINLELLMPA